MSSAPTRTLERTQYGAYIQSDAWRLVRRRFLESGLPKDCYVCGAAQRPGMHLHHRTYKSLGNENLSHLVLVCPECHQLAHDIERTENLPLWQATRQARLRVKRRLERRAAQKIRRIERAPRHSP